jgi:hypothetical protein
LSGTVLNKVIGKHIGEPLGAMMFSGVKIPGMIKNGKEKKTKTF